MVPVYQVLAIYLFARFSFEVQLCAKMNLPLNQGSWLKMGGYTFKHICKKIWLKWGDIYIYNTFVKNMHKSLLCFIVNYQINLRRSFLKLFLLVFTSVSKKLIHQVINYQLLLEVLD